MVATKKRTLLVGGGVAAGLALIFFIGWFVVARDGNDGLQTTPTPSRSGDVKVDVEQAYLRFWDVLAKANENLDTSGLPEVLSGPALDQAKALVEEARQKNEPIRTVVEHDYRISITPEFASVDDSFVDRSVRLDPQTKEPVGPPANKMVHNSYTLKKVDGKWKVTEIIGYR